MTVLITGATGFVGGHLARRLVADREDVHVIVRPASDVTTLPAGGHIAIEWGGGPHRPREVMRPWTAGASLPGWQSSGAIRRAHHV
jgi:nucleoside-diphosphate-sugar epimerase